MAAAGPSRRVFEIFVARVPWTAGPNEVKQYFAQFGSVRKCMLPFDKETGFHKGFCWIGFSTEEGVKNSLQKDTHILEGSKLSFNTSQAVKEDPIKARFQALLTSHALKT